MGKTKKPNKENVEDILALSSMQEGLLFHHLKENEDDLYFEQLSIQITGDVNFSAFNRAWNAVVENNEMLRTIFAWKKLNRPVQIVLKEIDIPIKQHDFSIIKDKVEKQRLLTDLKERDRATKFDLEKGPLFRVTLCKLSEENYEIIISNHHIIYDGWSVGNIFKEFLEFYSSFNHGQKPQIETKPKFKEYLKWLGTSAQENEFDENYWKEYLDGFDQKTMLPLAKECKTDDQRVKRFTYHVSPETKQQLEHYAKTEKITVGTILNTVWGILLQRYNNVEDVVFGTTVSGRSGSLSDIENMVGLFINTIPFRMKTTSAKKIADALQEINQTLQKRQNFENTPLPKIQSYSQIPPQESLFDSIVVIENYPLNQVFEKVNCGFDFQGYSTFEKCKYDLALEIILFDEIELNFLMQMGLYNEDVIGQLARRFESILDQIIHNHDITFAELEIVNAEERKRLLSDFNNSSSDYPKDQTLSQLFAEQVRRTPARVAVEYNDEQLTYIELNKKANQLARLLRNKGISNESIIGLMVERSIEMIIGIIGILKAGGAYMPIDPTYPEERITFMIEDSGTELLLIQKSLSEYIQVAREMIFIDEEEIFMEDESDLDCYSTSENLANVIYTSGTTGTPKGNEITHFNISRVVKNTNYIEITSSDRILQLSNYAFDGSTFDIYGALLNGGTLVLLEKEKILNLAQLAELIQSKNVTVFFITTALFNILVENHIDCLVNVRKILFGGERASVQYVKKALDELGPDKLIHVYES